MSRVEKDLAECKKMIQELNSNMKRLTEDLHHNRKAREEWETGIQIVKRASKINEQQFLQAAQQFFRYEGAPDYLAREIGPKLLQAKEKIISRREDEVIDNDNFKAFCSNLLNTIWAEKNPGQKKQGGSRRAPKEKLPKTWSPNSVIGPQVFEDPEEGVQDCPPVILEFQKHVDVTFEEEFMAPSHRMAVYLIRCLEKYKDLNPPKYLVGVMLGFLGAEMFIVHSKSVLEKRVSEDTVMQVSFKWDFEVMFQILEDNGKKEEEIEEFSEIRSFMKRTKTSETIAERSCYFYSLVDFVMYLLKVKTPKTSKVSGNIVGTSQ